MSTVGLVRSSSTALPYLLAAWALVTPEALAQPAQPPPPTPQSPPAPTTPTTPTNELGPGEAAIRERVDPLGALLAPDPAGLTYEQVAREAVAASTSVRSKEIEVESAEGAVSQTLVSFFPRVTLSASYTRLSEVTLPTLGGGGFSVVSQAAGPIGVAPCAQNPATQCAVDSAGNPVVAVDTSFSFPQVLNQIAFSGNLTVPISDYFLRAVQAYNGAEANEESLRLQVEAQKLTVAADAKLALIGWALSKGQTAVASQSAESAKNQLRDVNAALSADKAARVDVLRIEALVAQSEYTIAEAQSNEFVAEQRLRTLLRVRSDRPLTVGINLLDAPAIPELASVDVLFDEAVANRLELIATEKSRQALEEAASATRATYWPRLDAFADILIANPNQRVFPQQEEFDTTWDVGVRLTWVINDTFSTIGANAQASARTAQIESTKIQLMDAIRLEVVAAHAEVTKAKSSIEAANRGVVAAEETLRVSKKVFALGNITGTTLADQENALTAARLRKLSAYASLQSALIRLEHATGRDRRSPLAPTRAAVGD